MLNLQMCVTLFSGCGEDILLSNRVKVCPLNVCASCLGYPKNLGQVGGEQKTHSALFKKIHHKRKRGGVLHTRPTH